MTLRLMRLRNSKRNRDMIPTITTFGWVPEFARGFVRDMRPRWALEEVGQRYEVDLISDSEESDNVFPGFRDPR